MRQILTSRATIREMIGFRDIWLMAIGIPLIGFLVPILFFGATLDEGLIGYLPRWGVSMLYTACYWITVRWIFVYTRRRIPEPERVGRRIGLALLIFIPVYLGVNFGLDQFERVVLGSSYFNHEFSLLELNVASLSVILIISTLYESAFFYARWRESLVEQERLRRQHTESQLEGLKNQVNPHFLFNSLNTLAYIIPEDPERGVRFVQELSRVYRYMLEIRNYRLIPLQTELDFLEAYTFLLKERFADKIRFEYAIPQEARQQQIIPLSLQMLFENAIKHNEISTAHPLTISLQVEEGTLYVRNSLRRKVQHQPSTGVGLQNIRNRYAFFTQQEVEIDETDDYFLVGIPLMPAQVSVSSRQ